MGKHGKANGMMELPIFKEGLPGMFAKARNLQYEYSYRHGKLYIVAVGKERALEKFQADLEANGLIRVKTWLEEVAGCLEDISSLARTFAERTGMRGDRMIGGIRNVAVSEDGITFTMGFDESPSEKKEEGHGETVLESVGVCGEVQGAEEDLVPMDEGGEDRGENGYLPAPDTGRPADPGEGPGDPQVALPVQEEQVTCEDPDPDRWLTVKEYCAKYRISEQTVYNWIKKPKARTDPPRWEKFGKQVYIEDGDLVPLKDRHGTKFVYRWVPRDILEEADGDQNADG